MANDQDFSLKSILRDIGGILLLAAIVMVGFYTYHLGFKNGEISNQDNTVTLNDQGRAIVAPRTTKPTGKNIRMHNKIAEDLAQRWFSDVVSAHQYQGKQMFYPNTEYPAIAPVGSCKFELYIQADGVNNIQVDARRIEITGRSETIRNASVKALKADPHFADCFS